MWTSYEWQYSTSWEATRYRTIEGPCWFRTTWSVVLLRLWEPAFRVLSFFFRSLYSKLILFTSYLLRIVVAEIREMWNFLYPFWNCLVFLSLLYQDYNFLWVETPNALSLFFFTLKRTLGYYYGNDQNTTKTIKSRLWLCSNCQLYTFHSVLYVFSERKTGYLMPPYALAIHSSGSVLQEWWSAPKASLIERSYLFLCLFDKDEHWKIWFCGLKYDNRLGTKEIKYSR